MFLIGDTELFVGSSLNYCNLFLLHIATWLEDLVKSLFYVARQSFPNRFSFWLWLFS